MADSEILSTLNALSEGIVLADPSDLQTFATLHTHLQSVAKWAESQGLKAAPLHAARAADLMERIILNEVPDVGVALETVTKTVEAFQGIARDGRRESEVSFPADADGATATKSEPATSSSGAAPAQQGSGGDASDKPRTLEGDPDLLAEFISEAREHLENADVHLLTIESNPHDAEALNAVFRAFHTIKGVAGFLALEDVQTLAHESENLLDKARKQELDLEGGNIDVTFEAVDTMKRLVDHVAQSLSTGDPLALEADLPTLVNRLIAASSGQTPPEQAAPVFDGGKRFGEILIDSGMAEEAAVVRALDKQQLLEENLLLGEILIRESIIGRAQLEQALEHQEQEGFVRRLGAILVEMGAARTDDIDRAFQKQEYPAKPPLGEILVRAGDVEAKDAALALRAQKQKQGTVEVKEAIKVDADRLDRMIDLIGELVIAEAMVCQTVEMARSGDAQLTRQLGQLDKITRELQEMGMSLRMVPVRATFQKMARLVRDLAKKSGKEIEFVMEGEDTELDKTVVDKIGDPLVHMVRNSCDHGLESSVEERRKAGKPDTGRVTLRAFHKGGSIYIEIEDDGRGLNRDAILAKARERGLVREGEILSDREVWNLIFEAGFSTAKVVTDVSGRGVGMDVVRRNIESLRGQVEIQSEAGKGSVFSIRLPLTLAIIEGMVIRVGSERYIVPTLSVVRSIQPTPDQVSTVAGRGEMLVLQGDLIPLIRLHEMFDITGAKDVLSEALVMIVDNEGRRIGLVIDELLGQQQTVIKSLGQAMRDMPGISGGAIMSDGTVGLILDVGGIVAIAGAQSGARRDPSDLIGGTA